MTGAEEYGVEEHEVHAVLDNLVGVRDDADPAIWYSHLSSSQALLAEVVSRIADQRALAGLEIYESLQGKDKSYQTLADALNISRSKAQQLVERGRRVQNSAAPAGDAESRPA